MSNMKFVRISKESIVIALLFFIMWNGYVNKRIFWRYLHLLMKLEFLNIKIIDEEKFNNYNFY
jgi:hypothetical protein